MTDLETMIAMLKRAGIEYGIADFKLETDIVEEVDYHAGYNSNGDFIGKVGFPKFRKVDVVELTVVEGYIGFYSTMTFIKESGDLLKIAAYE